MHINRLKKSQLLVREYKVSVHTFFFIFFASFFDSFGLLSADSSEIWKNSTLRLKGIQNDTGRKLLPSWTVFFSSCPLRGWNKLLHTNWRVVGPIAPKPVTDRLYCMMLQRNKN